ncbi:hypothetical protein LOTGIDRAFT_158851 [Lottia gigantea]|uniref:HTH CENPB-type domain-containing protein n=1 Tax=Lottia gigantea TaxID=225164 RepID=V4AV97_LOTGI|nr:hypothetical protein LOTGIDRAFT_158851 [Lottia gigantea]ESO98895.1 hypothetical protein LOTGIDRAFT_158851 [Lottia gigantea]
MKPELIVVNEDIKYEVIEIDNCLIGVDIADEVSLEEEIHDDTQELIHDPKNDKWHKFLLEMESFISNTSLILNENNLIKEAKKIARKMGIKNLTKCKSLVLDILEKCDNRLKTKLDTLDVDCAAVRRSARQKARRANHRKKKAKSVKDEETLPSVHSNSLRRSYTANKKLDIIKFAEEMGGNRAASRQFNIPEGCVRQWRKMKTSLERATGTKTAFRGRCRRWAAVDDKLMELIDRKGRDSQDLCKQWIFKQAEDLAKELKFEKFKATSTWYSAFLHRNNLTITNRSKVECRKNYTTEFKLQVVKFAEERGGNHAASRHFGITESNVRQWRKKKSELEKEDYVPYKPAGLKEQWPELEERLRNFIIERQDVKYSDELRKANVIFQAKKFASEMNITNFTGSLSWYFNFVRRKNLKGFMTKRADYARASYTTQFKLEVVKYVDEYGFKAAVEKYGINRSSVGIWQKTRQVLEKTDGNRKSLRCCFNGKYVDLEDKLSKYALEHESECCGVTEHQLRSKARIIAQELKLKDFRESNGWFFRFLKRKGIKLSDATNNDSDEVLYHNENGYVCGICCKVFEKQYHYRIHIAIHIEGTKNLCHICGKTYDKP